MKTLITLMGMLALAVSSSAQNNYYWNGGSISSNPANGGTGTWSTTNAWRVSSSTGNQATWADNNKAFIVGNPGELTISNSPIATEIRFITSGYTIKTSGTTSRTLNGSIFLNDNVKLSLAPNSGNVSSGALGIGSISGGLGSTLQINGKQSSSNAARINLGNNVIIGVPITINGTGTGSIGFVATGAVGPPTVSADIINNSPMKTILGATSSSILALNGSISGTAALQFSAGASGGAGTILLNSQSTYSGATLFNAATSSNIKLGIDNALPVTTAVLLGSSSSNGGVFDLNGYNQTIGSLSSGSGTGKITNNNTGIDTSELLINGSEHTSFSLLISGKLSLIHSGIGSLSLNSINTYSGITRINNGIIYINGELAEASFAEINPVGILAGKGILKGAVQVKGLISPGAIGDTCAQLNIGSLELAENGSYLIHITDNANDKIKCFESIQINSTSDNPFKLVLNTPDTLSAFDGLVPFQCVVISGLRIEGFEPSKFLIEIKDFTRFHELKRGSFKIESNDTTIIIVFQPAETDASLADIVLEHGNLSPAFDPGIYDYSVLLPYGTLTTPSLSVLKNNEKSTYTIKNAENIQSDSLNKRTSLISIIAEDSVHQLNYKVVFNVESPNQDANLKELYTSEGTLEPIFNALIDNYTVYLPFGTNEAPEISAIPYFEKAVVYTEMPVDIHSNLASDRTAIIKVIAQDTNFSMSYHILFEIIPPRKDALLQYLKVNNSELQPGFDQYTFYYQVNLPWNSVNAPAMELSTSDSTATIELIPVKSIWSADSTKRTAHIKVTAQDTSIKEEYKVCFTVIRSKDADLKTLTANFGIFEPYFDPSVTNYTLTIPARSSKLPFLSYSTANDSANTSLNQQDSSYQIQVTAHDSTIKRLYTINIQYSYSDDASLASLEPSFGNMEPAFDPEVLNYQVYLPKFSKEAPHLLAISNDSYASLMIDSAINILSDDTLNHISRVIVIAEDGMSQRIYTLQFHVPELSSMNELSSFSFINIPSTGYITNDSVIIAVPVGLDKTHLRARFQSSEYSTVWVDSIMQISDSTKNDFSNPVTYKVIAENGFERYYIIQTKDIIASLVSNPSYLEWSDTNMSIKSFTLSGTCFDTIFFDCPEAFNLSFDSINFSNNLNYRDSTWNINNLKVYVNLKQKAEIDFNEAITIRSKGIEQLIELKYLKIKDPVGINKQSNSLKITYDAIDKQLLIKCSSQELKKFSLLDLSGKLILRETNNETTFSINMSAFAKGVYVYLLEQNGQIYRDKVIIE